MSLVGDKQDFPHDIVKNSQVPVLYRQGELLAEFHVLKNFDCYDVDVLCNIETEVRSELNSSDEIYIMQ